MDTFNLDIDDFRAWLTAAGPYSIIGHACNGDDCPIANYLKRVHNTGEMHVGRLWVDIGDARYNPSNQIRWYINHIDLAEKDAPITAEHALDALKKMPGFNNE